MIVVVTIFLFSLESRAASTFTEDFNNGLSPDLSISSWSAPNDGGFTYAITNGTLVFTQESGYRTGVVSLMTNFYLLGDFSVSVQASFQGMAGSGALSDAGLMMWYAPNPNGMQWANLTYSRKGWGDTDPWGYYGRITQNPTQWLDAGPDGTLTIQRTGNTVAMFFNGQNVLQGFDVGGPVQPGLILSNFAGSNGYLYAVFDNLSITADGFAPVPLPSTLLLLGSGLLGMGGLAWRRLRN